MISAAVDSPPSGQSAQPDQHANPVRNAMSDRVYHLLRNRIIHLEYQPGARLPIDQLRNEFDVSPSPVREALNRLVAQGLVTAAAYRGFRVSDLLDPDELRQLLHARRVVEEAAARDAIAQANEATLTRLRELVDQMDQLAATASLDVKAFNATDAEFHRVIVEASTNRYLLQLFDSLHAHVQIARHFHGRSPAEAAVSNHEHRQILEAFEAGDARQASSQVKSHIDQVVIRLRSTRGDGPR